MAISPPTNIDTLNALPIPSFRAQLFPYDSTLRYNNGGVATPLELSLETSSSISPTDMKACFNLIASTSSEDYKASSTGWSPAKKREEMRLPDLRYIILRRKTLGSDGSGGTVVGFLSFMLTYEDGYVVVYCYEVHLTEELQGKGIGKRLMEMMEEMGKRAGVAKAMLTSFKANGNAMTFYERRGYEEDEYSPRPRKLRNGVVKEPDHVILSKAFFTNIGKLKVEDEKSTANNCRKRKAG